MTVLDGMRILERHPNSKIDFRLWCCGNGESPSVINTCPAENDALKRALRTAQLALARLSLALNNHPSSCHHVVHDARYQEPCT